MFAEDIGATLKLAGCAFLVSVVFGVPIGMIGALKRRTGTGRLVMSVAL
jgi:ABC-type dipeptide/oligopeptide/nickel transport system permease component